MCKMTLQGSPGGMGVSEGFLGLSAESVSFDLRANEIEAPEPWSVELQRHTWKHGLELHPKLLTGICPQGRNTGRAEYPRVSSYA